MVDFERGLHTELQSVSGLNTKVFPMNAPEGTTVPFLIYSKSSGEMIKTLDGISRTRDMVYEIDIICGTYADLQLKFDLVKAKITSMIGRTISTNSVFVQSVIIQNMIELYEDEPRWYRINLEVRFYFKEV